MKMLRPFIIFWLAVVLVACGGGGGSSGSNPNQPNLISTAGESLIIPVGAFREYVVSGGVPPYQVSSSEPAIAVGSIKGNALSIGALSGGKATIRVFDFQGKTFVTEVTVGSSVPLYTTAPTSLNIGIGVTRSFVIGGGAPPYTVVGSNSSVATVVQSSATGWSITGVAANATGTVKIRDAAGATVEVNVSTTPPELRISPDKLTMPSGIEAQVTLSGGQPPYAPAGGIPAAIQVTPATSTDGKFKILGNLASKLDVTFLDSAGQSAKVEVEINTATVSYRLSPSPISISENSTDDLTFSLFGFYGDSSTGASSGTVCVYLSDPAFFTLDASRSTCSTFSSSSRTFRLITGTRGNRCVTTDTPIEIRAVDSQGSVASGVLTIVNNGVNCLGASNGLSVTPNSIAVQNGLSSNVAVRGGNGRYTAVSANLNVATVTVAGDIVSVTGRGTSGNTVVTVTDIDTGASTTFSVTNGTGVAPGGLSFSSSNISVSPTLSNSVVIFGGSGTYLATSSNPAVATAAVTGTTATITGGTARGSSVITIVDTVSGNFGTINVTNGNPLGTLRLSPSIIYTTPATSVTTVISGGSGDGNYRISNVNSAIVETAAINGVVATFTGGAAAGALTAVVYDVVTNDMASVLVINNANNALVATPANIDTLAVGATLNVAITNGTGSYRVSSADPGIATISIVGQTATVTGVSRGATTVTATDTTTGRSVIVGVSVQ